MECPAGLSLAGAEVSWEMCVCVRKWKIGVCLHFCRCQKAFFLEYPCSKMDLVCTYAHTHTHRHVITEPLKSPPHTYMHRTHSAVHVTQCLFSVTGNVAVYRNGVFDEGEIGGNSIFLQQRGWYTYVCRCVNLCICTYIHNILYDDE